MICTHLSVDRFIMINRGNTHCCGRLQETTDCWLMTFSSRLSMMLSSLWNLSHDYCGSLFKWRSSLYHLLPPWWRLNNIVVFWLHLLTIRTDQLWSCLLFQCRWRISTGCPFFAIVKILIWVNSEPIQSNGSFQKVVLLQEPTAVSLQCLVVSVYCAGDHHLGWK